MQGSMSLSNFIICLVTLQYTRAAIVHNVLMFDLVESVLIFLLNANLPSFK